MLKLLIVDDNKQIASVLSDYAKKEGYDVVLAHDGEAALEKFEIEQPDLLLLDVMMPKLDGFAVCRKIRQTSNVPIIMITARGEDFERIMGLEIGADDYIVKPFSPAVVLAHVKAMLRRMDKVDSSNAQAFHLDTLHIYLDSYTATLNDTLLPLTKKEIEILWTLATNKNKVFTRDNLLNSLWGYDYFGDTRTVDSHIKRLRAKVDEQEHPSWSISTIRGVGYKFEVMEHV